MTSAKGASGGRPSDGRALVLRDLVKRFGDVPAVDGVDLEVRDGEFLTLLGPSGSGKTTTLRMIAGFMTQTSGTIEIGGTDMTRIPPYRRDVGMVFQNYALFPHMTAGQNVAFPLEMRRLARPEINRRVGEALALVRLESLAGRYPRQLSGGQQQRIALARAVVFSPRLLLMDEPLGALDKKLREALQLEIVRVSRELGATVIYVTHDQEEALVMSDRIAIFKNGRIEQLGSGEDLYDRPVSMFVADFIGESSILRGRLERAADGAYLSRNGSRWRVDEATLARAALADGTAGALVVRPERMRIGGPDEKPPAGSNAVEATVSAVLYLGSDRKYELALPDGERAVVRQQLGGGEREWQRGDRVTLWWPVESGVLVADASA
ncbi:MAG TPA: ABC transporter ATP-binding protein [Candidatus Limnocylindrales bacterium]|nr:ABC transporter ATP-binding protein [Candidatus Limnocylindrales bacterium]